jgi:hypothetical protein
MSLHNDRQISYHPPTTKLAGQLVCPHCQTSFPLTWRRYSLSPWGNYCCPQCKQISQLKDNSSWLWLIRIAGIMIYVILFINVFSYIFNSSGVVATLMPERLLVLLMSIVVGLLIDKWIDGNMTHLKIRS